MTQKTWNLSLFLCQARYKYGLWPINLLVAIMSLAYGYGSLQVLMRKIRGVSSQTGPSPEVYYWFGNKKTAVKIKRKNLKRPYFSAFKNLKRPYFSTFKFYSSSIICTLFFRKPPPPVPSLLPVHAMPCIKIKKPKKALFFQFTILLVFNYLHPLLPATLSPFPVVTSGKIKKT